MNEGLKVLGLIAHFDGPETLLRAAKAMRAEGYSKFDCHSPYPIHGMDQAMGLKRSPVGWIAGMFALTGMVVALGMQFWMNSVDYPIVISGKPLYPWQAFVPITFELSILFTAIGAVLGMFVLNKLPQVYNALFGAPSFGKFSDDGFVLSVEAKDSKFSETETKAFLASIGGENVEEVREL